MSNPTKLIIDCKTNEQKYVELTDDEVREAQARAEANEIRRQEEEAQAQRLKDLKASAKAKLIAGEPLTEEEAETLGL